MAVQEIIQGKQRGERGGEGDGDGWADKVFHKCGNRSLDLPSSTELLSVHGDLPEIPEIEPMP